MQTVSRVGDWPAHVIAGLLGIAIAFVMKSKTWMRIFLAMLVALALAGVTGRVVKLATGRARPSVKTEAHWNGPRFSSKYHAFPSGHTASSTAFFVALFLKRKKIGAPLLLIPVLIALSRMVVGAHYLSDVTFAAILGVICAVLATRWLSTRDSSQTNHSHNHFLKTAEGVGFEPTRACALPVFKTGAINHSTTPPGAREVGY